MKTLAEKWNNMAVTDRAALAIQSGISGRAGSLAWDNLSEDQKEAIAETSAIEAVVSKTLGKVGKPDLEVARISKAGPRINRAIQAVHTDENIKKGVEIHKKMIADAQDKPKPSARRGKAQDYLLWIGWGSYPTIKIFTDEAMRLGVSRRICKAPNSLVLGKSKIFLTHDEGEKGDAVIFGYFTPERIEVIVHSRDNGMPEGLDGIATPITTDDASKEERRGCGYRQDIGAIYAVSGSITILKEFKDYNKIIDGDATRFRSVKKVNGEAILGGPTKIAPSLRHQISKKEHIKQQEQGNRWNDVETAVLDKALKNCDSQRSAFKHVSKVTGRTIYAIEYQYHKRYRLAQ